MKIEEITVGDEVIFHWHKMFVYGTVYKKGRKYIDVCFIWNKRWRKTKFKPDDIWKYLSKTGNKQKIDQNFIYWIEKEAFTGRE